MLDLNAIRQKLLRGYSHIGAYHLRMDEMQRDIAMLIADNEQIGRAHADLREHLEQVVQENARLRTMYEEDVQEGG